MTIQSTIVVSETPVACAAVSRFQLDYWADDFGVVAGITGAEGGMDLGFWGHEKAGHVMDFWQRLIDSFGGRFRQVVLGHQVHGQTVDVIERSGCGILIKEGVDGHATMEPGVLLVVLVADCVPVYLLNAKTKAMALLHAGWRGIAAGILSTGIDRLKSFGPIAGNDLVMHCGVSICGDCYEVGSEVMAATCGALVQNVCRLDLRGVLADQAANLGIERITRSAWCTVHDKGLFHSYRGLGESAGRMAAYLGVPLS